MSGSTIYQRKAIEVKRLKSVLVALLFGAMGHATAAAPAAAPSSAQAPAMSAGEVRKVDKAQGKVTLRHGPLNNLGMPAMTMVFRVKEPAMLDQLQEGDKIDFVAQKIDGAITVVEFKPAR